MADIDYTAMSGPDLLEACGDSGAKWATAFCQHAERLGTKVDEEWMMGWFANAIESSHDLRMNRTLRRDERAFPAL